jgi:hypothetical protein
MEDIVKEYQRSRTFKRWQDSEIGRATKMCHSEGAILALMLTAKSKRQIKTLAEKRLPEMCQLSRPLLREVEVLWKIMDAENEKDLVLEWLCDVLGQGKPALCEYYANELMKGKKALHFKSFESPVPRVIFEHKIWGAEISLDGVDKVKFLLNLHIKAGGHFLYADFRLTKFKITEKMALALRKQMPEFQMNWNPDKQYELSMVYTVQRPEKSLLAFEERGSGTSSPYLDSVQLGDGLEAWLLEELQKQSVPVVTIIRSDYYY